MLNAGASADNIFGSIHGFFGSALPSLELHGGYAWAPWFA